MELIAEKVLNDCRRAYDFLERGGHSVDSWRVKWIGALALIRMVGHVLDKVDGVSPSIAIASKTLYKEWKNPAFNHIVFTGFIEKQRNMALKEYEIGVVEADDFTIVLDHQTDTHSFQVVADLFRPISDGPWAGEDARGVYLMAIEWWSEQLLRLRELID